MSERMPEAGFTTEARVIKVVDADTVDVEIRRVVRVRLSHPNKEKLDFNAPEKSTPAGKQAKDYLELIFNGIGTSVMVFFLLKLPTFFLTIRVSIV